MRAPKAAKAANSPLGSGHKSTGSKPPKAVDLRALAEEPEPLRDEGGNVITLSVALTHHCRWPIGDIVRGELQICGHQTLPGKSWCAHHATRVLNRLAVLRARQDQDKVPTLKERALRRAQ